MLTALPDPVYWRTTLRADPRGAADVRGSRRRLFYVSESLSACDRAKRVLHLPIGS